MFLAFSFISPPSHLSLSRFFQWLWIKVLDGGYSFAPFWCLCQTLSLSPLYFNKTFLHKSSEWSSLVSGPGWIHLLWRPRIPRLIIQQQSFILGAHSGSFRTRWAWQSMWAYFCWLQKSWVCHLIFKTMSSWAHSYAAFHSWSNCWVCGPLPSSSVKGIPWWTSPLEGKDFLQVCKYLQQSHVMPLLKLMTSNNRKMNWCNYGHNVTFHFILTWFNDYFALRL